MSTSEVNDLLLEEQACFALYAASRAVTDLYRPMLAELDLTYPQYLVLLVLWERDGQSVKQIGEALQLDYGTVSPVLKRLEAGGLLTRSRRAADERSVTVALTASGTALRARAERIPQRIGCATGLDHEGRRALIRTLRELTASVRSAAPERS